MIFNTFSARGIRKSPNFQRKIFPKLSGEMSPRASQQQGDVYAKLYKSTMHTLIWSTNHRKRLHFDNFVRGKT